MSLVKEAVRQRRKTLPAGRASDETDNFDLIPHATFDGSADRGRRRATSALNHLSQRSFSPWKLVSHCFKLNASGMDDDGDMRKENDAAADTWFSQAANQRALMRTASDGNRSPIKPLFREGPLAVGDEPAAEGDDEERTIDEPALPTLDDNSDESACGESSVVLPSDIKLTVGLSGVGDNVVRSFVRRNFSSPVSAGGDAKPFFRTSRFSNVPPTIAFYSPGEKVETPSRQIRSVLKWCHNSLVPKVIRKTLYTSHFEIVDERLFWIGYWGRHLKTTCYKHFSPFQKINHFPGAFHMGRKDRLWGHISRMEQRWPDSGFDITPHSYVLPREAAKLKALLRTAAAPRQIILKPPASARGSGIRIVHRWQQIPKKTPLIAQHYVDRPFLINGSKFDLRLYVYVSSLEPLRVYLYEEGLVRFATVKYSNAFSSQTNRYMHLTNYSINKVAIMNGGNDADENKNPGGAGCKWSVRRLWQYLMEEGHDVHKLMERIVDVILKAVVSCEGPISQHVDRHAAYPFICHELFGFDILLDQYLRPWLLEVNISPSLHSGTELDRQVKVPLAKDVMNLAGIQVPDKTQIVKQHLPFEQTLLAPLNSHNCDYRTKPSDSMVTEAERDKQRLYVERFLATQRVDRTITDLLTPTDVRILVATEDEWERRGQFTRLIPSPYSSAYLRYVDTTAVRYSNLLLDEWTAKYFHNRQQGCARLEALCAEKFHVCTSPLSDTAVIATKKHS